MLIPALVLYLRLFQFQNLHEDSVLLFVLKLLNHRSSNSLEFGFVKKSKFIQLIQIESYEYLRKILQKSINYIIDFREDVINQRLALLFLQLNTRKTIFIQKRVLEKEKRRIYHIKLKQLLYKGEAMRGKFERFKKSVESNYGEGQNIVYEVLQIIQNLHQSRIVEVIARPISYQIKQALFQTFKQKFQKLNFHLSSLRKEMPKESETRNQRVKGTNSTVGVRPRVKKQDIHKIQTAYRQAFIEGSFKYYYMVAKLQGLPLTLDVLGIQEWAAECLAESEKGCC